MALITPSQFHVDLVLKGVRLGGCSSVLAKTSGAPTLHDVEQAAHPDWDSVEGEERYTKCRERFTSAGDRFDECASSRVETVGLASLYDRGEAGWALSSFRHGWLPRAFTDRAAALIAYGYVLGGEEPGQLEVLRDRVNGQERRPIEAADLVAFAAH